MGYGHIRRPLHVLIPSLTLEARVDLVQIYDSEASYSYHLRAPDRRYPSLRPDADDVHPWYAIHLYSPERAANEDPGENGAGYALIPHARLEYMAARFGFQPDEVDVILDTLLHLPAPGSADPLAGRDLTARKVSRALDRLPDPTDPSLGRKRQRQALIDHASVVKEHQRLVQSAPQADRQFVLDWRSGAIKDWETKLGALGEELPAEYQLGRDEIAPEHPLAAILDGGPLDGRRIAARMARDAWLEMRADTAAEREAAALHAPMTFAFHRSMPDVQALTGLAEAVQAELDSKDQAVERGSAALATARERRTAPPMNVSSVRGSGRADGTTPLEDA